MATHLEETLQRDINLIREKVLEMSAQGEAALKKCLKALLERNLTMAYSVILRDKEIDELENELLRHKVACNVDVGAAPSCSP